MLRGACLCGGVRFEIERAVGPFELCHCSRCRKASGSAYLAALGVRTAEFRFLAGQELICRFELPVRDEPPPYSRTFCRRCGCMVPDPPANDPWFEIPAGLLEGDPSLRPERHIMIEHKAPWTIVSDDLPQLDLKQLLRLRAEHVPTVEQRESGALPGKRHDDEP